MDTHLGIYRDFDLIAAVKDLIPKQIDFQSSINSLGSSSFHHPDIISLNTLLPPRVRTETDFLMHRSHAPLCSAGYGNRYPDS